MSADELVNAWVAESNQLRRECPGFSLYEMVQDEEFRTFLILGYSVKRAYQIAIAIRFIGAFT